MPSVKDRRQDEQQQKTEKSLMSERIIAMHSVKDRMQYQTIHHGLHEGECTGLDTDIIGYRRGIRGSNQNKYQEQYTISLQSKIKRYYYYIEEYFADDFRTSPSRMNKTITVVEGNGKYFHEPCHGDCLLCRRQTQRFKAPNVNGSTRERDVRRRLRFFLQPSFGRGKRPENLR